MRAYGGTTLQTLQCVRLYDLGLVVLMSSKLYFSANGRHAGKVSLQGSPHRLQQIQTQSAEHARNALALAEKPCLRTFTRSSLLLRQVPFASGSPSIRVYMLGLPPHTHCCKALSGHPLQHVSGLTQISLQLLQIDCVCLASNICRVKEP